jgi:WD40 repeat protein
VLDIAVSTDNARFVSVGGDKNVLLWDVAQARVLRRWEGHVGRVNACTWAGDGREEGLVVTGKQDHGYFLNKFLICASRELRCYCETVGHQIKLDETFNDFVRGKR